MSNPGSIGSSSHVTSVTSAAAGGHLNSYGFDFLKSAHLDSDRGSADVTSSHAHGLSQPLNSHNTGSTSSAKPTASLHHKSDLEKQADILGYLLKHRGTGQSFDPSTIYAVTGIDLDVDVNVAQMLQRNNKVRTEMIPDPENPALLIATYAYQPTYSNVRDRGTLLAQINRMHWGIPMRDLLDSYLTVEQDLQKLITGGEIIAVQNTEDKDKILFPRGDVFLVELDGHIRLPSNPAKKKATATSSSSIPSSSTSVAGPCTDLPGDRKLIHHVITDTDTRPQIRRGEAVQVGGQWFRVSSAVREGPLSEQPARAQAPLSVVSLQDLNKRNEIDGYIRPFSSTTIPVDIPLPQEAVRNVKQGEAARDKLSSLVSAATTTTSTGSHQTNATSLHHGSRNVTGQLLGSTAHAANPTALVATLVSNSRNGIVSGHRRPVAIRASSATFSSSGVSKGAADDAANIKAALIEAASDPALALYGHARRHGCTRDIRDLYFATRSLVPESDPELQKTLVQHGLLSPHESMRRPRLKRAGLTNLDNDGKPKKRRYYEPKKQRMTNTHLEGTEIGAVLARAAEQQRQGRAVGDGGM